MKKKNYGMIEQENEYIAKGDYLREKRILKGLIDSLLLYIDVIGIIAVFSLLFNILNFFLIIILFHR